MERQSGGNRENSDGVTVTLAVTITLCVFHYQQLQSHTGQVRSLYRRFLYFVPFVTFVVDVFMPSPATAF